LTPILREFWAGITPIAQRAPDARHFPTWTRSSTKKVSAAQAPARY
jgi:hypothetical protein